MKYLSDYALISEPMKACKQGPIQKFEEGQAWEEIWGKKHVWIS